MTRPKPSPVVRAVLDRSALLSYARGHIHVGEAISEIADESGARVGIPSVALLEAHLVIAADKDSRGLLRHLAALPVTTLLTVDEQTASDVADVAVLTRGDLGQAHAAWVTVALNAWCLSATPDQIPSIVQRDVIIPIPLDDA